MNEQGPDPDKNAFRFAINRQLQRWKDLRPAWVEMSGEESALEIDQQLEFAMRPENLDDAMHARDYAATLERHLDEFVSLSERQQAVTNRQADLLARARKNAADNAGRGLGIVNPRAVMQSTSSPYVVGERLSGSRENIEPSSWKLQPLHREINGGMATLRFEAIEDLGDGKYAADVRMTSGQFDGRGRLHWRETHLFHDTIVNLGERGRNAVNLALALSEERPAVHIQLSSGSELAASFDAAFLYEITDVEVTKGVSIGASFPDLPVRVPMAIPEDMDLDGESREEAEARLRQVHAIAGVHAGSLDPRDLREIIAEDEQRAILNANAETADVPFATKWSDAPAKELGARPPKDVRIAELSRALTVLYKAAGLNVTRLAIIGDDLVLVVDGREIKTTIPAVLRKHLED